MKGSKKIAFFGTPPFTVDFLEALYEDGYVPSLVITNPDRPVGRGMQLTPPAPKEWGEKHGIRVLQPEKITDEFVQELSQEHWDLFVVIAYGSILPEKLISLPRFGTINVHYSLLPKYRGATPVESAILNGDTVTGVCIQQMRFALDSGSLIAQKEVSIDPGDTTLSLRTKLNTEALTMLPDTLMAILSESITPVEQDEASATFCKKIKKEDGKIDLTDDAVKNDRLFRAYFPSPGTFFFIEKNGKQVRVKIKAAHLESGQFILDEIIPENGKPLTEPALKQWLNS